MTTGWLLFILFVLIVVIYVYFLPTFVASKRGHPQAVPIFFVNLFFGWSLIGWILTLIWAYSGNRSESQQINVYQTNVQPVIDSQGEFQQGQSTSNSSIQNKTVPISSNTPFPKLIIDGEQVNKFDSANAISKEPKRISSLEELLVHPLQKKQSNSLLYIVILLLITSLSFGYYFYSKYGIPEKIKAKLLLGSNLWETDDAINQATKQLMDDIYGNFDVKRDCWKVTSPEHFNLCMQIDNKTKILSSSGARLYVMAKSLEPNSEEQANLGHASGGLVGLFILENQNEKYKVITSDPQIVVGSWGRSIPLTLVKLGANDYWGWSGSSGYSNMGETIDKYMVYAPYGKKFKMVANIQTGYSNESLDGSQIENYKSTVEFNTNKLNDKAFPILVTVTGGKNGTPILKKTWTFNFNVKKWEYSEPKGFLN